MDRDIILIGAGSINERIFFLEERGVSEIILIVAGDAFFKEEPVCSLENPIHDLVEDFELTFYKRTCDPCFVLDLQEQITHVYVDEESCVDRLLLCGDLQIKWFLEYMSGVPP